ncbi:MAG: hypothetical protein IKM59_04905 [Oscillospiraceae bacterium]|nr:hypothetical protein [Oscillospiraceae bacterium]
MDISLIGPVLIILFLIGLILYAACKSPPEEALRYPEMKNKVTLFTHECGHITWKEKKKERRIEIHPEKKLDNRRLQYKAMELVTHTPINTMIRITNYAWDLCECLRNANYLPANWEPVGAYQFCNGIVMVRYMEKPPEKGKANTDSKDLYFASSDGHLIHWRA